MKFDSPFQEAAEFDCVAGSMDRRIIRVEIPPAYAGITAALRRAFEPIGLGPGEPDFADLLRKLN